MEKECMNCGAIFEANKNRRYCDACDEILDFNINTPLPNIYIEKYNDEDKLKSQQIGYFCAEENGLYYCPTKMSGRYPYEFEYPKDLKNKFLEFNKLLNKSNNKSKIEELPKDIGLILKNGVMYRQILVNGFIHLIELKGDYIFPPPPKKYPIYKNQCKNCIKIFWSFSNKAKYCPNCKSKKKSEWNKTYRKMKKNLRKLTLEERRKLESQGYELKYYNLGSSELGTNQDKEILAKIKEKRQKYK